MKILTLSDLHLEHRAFEIPAVDHDVVVLAGDIRSPGAEAIRWVRRSVAAGVPVVFVPGNHEYYDSSLQVEQARMRDEAVLGDVHLLDCGTVVIQGVRFIGCTLWTDFMLPIASTPPLDPVVDPALGMSSCERVLADYRCIDVDGSAGRRRLVAQDTLTLHGQHRQWLLDELQRPFAGPTVVVTHHAPHRGSLAPRYAGDRVSTGFVSELPPAFFEVPVLWIHGHTHTSFDYAVAGCRVVCNPRGYPMRSGGWENERFDPGLVVEIQGGDERDGDAAGRFEG